jgi:hypothetical protein
MAKMVIWIVVLALVLYLSFAIKLGDYTFSGHLRRILDTDEAHELWNGIAETVTSTKESAQEKVKERLDEAKEAEDGEEEDDEPSEAEPVRFRSPLRPLPQQE